MRYVPEWWPTVLLTLAAFRVTRLLGWDDLTEPWRARVRRRGRTKLRTMIECPWCLGWWVAVAWWVAWLLEDHWTLVAATPWALSALIGLIAKGLDP